MGIIRQLPTSVINQIAAGEVVERPSSVLKELLENAIDAGATRVDVAVERGGKDLVRIADNGRGMDRDDLQLAFRPHATSKLADASDLCRIGTLGFRGEALAAIAEVSKVRCQTRTAEAAAGLELTIDGGTAGEIRDCGCPPGTVIEVRNLFYNTPVRRTFLKADSTESGHVVEAFMRVALANPTIHLTFRSGGKTVYDLPAVTGIKERVAVFFGKELAEALLWVESKVESSYLWGYVAHPSQSRSSGKGQFLFVGGRFVRDRSLAHALAEAYRGLLMVGRMPVAFLYLEMAPDEVDVNVHPTKIEVRFRDPQRLYSQVLSTIRQVFLSSDLQSRLHAPPKEAEAESPASFGRSPSYGLTTPSPDHQKVASWFAPSTPVTAAASPPSLFGEPRKSVSNLPPASVGNGSLSFDEFQMPDRSASPASASTEMPAPTDSAESHGAAADTSAARPSGQRSTDALPTRALQVHDSYLIAETDEGMVVIDQHALHERILYEEMRLRVEQGGVESQQLLVPEPVDLTAVEAAAVLERREVLGRLGLNVEPFGGDTVLVTSTPVMLKHVPADRLLRDLADHFRTKPLPPSADALLEDVLNMMACKGAIKAGQRLSPLEVAALLERRHLAVNSHHCPHGRPTSLTFTKSELERQFGRT